MGVFTNASLGVKEEGKQQASREHVSEKIKRKEKGLCYLCGKLGHIKSKCPDSKQATRVKPNPSQNTKGNEPKCKFCSTLGHVEDQCFKKKKACAKPL